MDDRIKLAKALKWVCVVDIAAEDVCLVIKNEGELPVSFDPFTDANDDYAVLEWVRSNTDAENPLPIKSQVWDFYVALNDAVAIPSDYQIGDYARAALKVIE